MAKTEPFEQHSDLYEKWFAENHFMYQSELLALKTLLPGKGNGLEIGVGTGRFAQPLGINEGVEPSAAMRKIAGDRGIHTKDAVAEKLPYPKNSFDFALMVTTICFVDNVKKAFAEAYRVLKQKGSFMVGIVDKKSALGKYYEKIKEENLFYKHAVFYSTDEVIDFFRKAGFMKIEVVQTIFGNLTDIRKIQPVKKGYGEGSFVGVKGIKT